MNVLTEVSPDERYCSAVPENTLRPSGSTTDRAFAMGAPDLAWIPSTVTVSPTFSAFLVHPFLESALTAASSTFQLTTVPFGCATSM
jgi:hypothetical protein